MTLILGMVCNDGAVLAADRKLISRTTGKAIYNFNKIYLIDNIIAIAVAGTAYFDNVIKKTSDLVRGMMELNPNMPLNLIATELVKRHGELLAVEEANLVIILASYREIYYIQAHGYKGLAEARVDKLDSAVAGIKEVNFLPYKGSNTTLEYSEYFKRVLKVNKGKYVGGRTQVVILKRKTQ